MRSKRSIYISSIGLAGSLFALGAPQPAKAGSLDAAGNLSLEVNVQFPVSAAQRLVIQEQFERAQLQLCDATEGAVKIKQVRFTYGSENEESADIWWFNQPGRAYVRSRLEKNGKVVLFRSSISGDVIAHELGHLVLDLRDAYDEQERSGACGIGPSIELPGSTLTSITLDAVNNTMMQQADKQYCVNNANRTHGDLGNPYLTPSECLTDADCAGFTNRAYASNPSDPSTARYTRCSRAPLSSELTVARNNDLIRGSGATQCPGPLAPNLLRIDAVLSPTYRESKCGDGTLDPSEQCEGSRSRDCGALGMSSGASASCNSCRWDRSACAPVDPALCGDGKIDAGENCDGAQLGANSCQSLGFLGGRLACASNCGFDLSDCELASDLDTSSRESMRATADYYFRLSYYDELGKIGEGEGESVRDLHVAVENSGPNQLDLFFAVDEGDFGGTSGRFRRLAKYRLNFVGTTLSLINGVRVDPSGAVLGSPTPVYPKLVLGGRAAQNVPFGSDPSLGQREATGVFPANSEGVSAAPVVLDLELGLMGSRRIAHKTPGSPYAHRRSERTGLFHRQGNSLVPQRGLCEKQKWCEAIWNEDTQKYEGTSGTRSRIRRGKEVLDEWTLAADHLSDVFGITVSPRAIVNPIPLSRAQCGGPVTFVNELPADQDRVVIVMDHSGSMSAPSVVEDGDTRLEFAKAAARMYAALVENKSTEIGLIAFSDVSQVIQDLRGIGSGVGEVELSDFNEKVNKMTPANDTAMADALLTAKGLVGPKIDPSTKRHVNRAIYFLSDGQDNPPAGKGGVDPLTIANELKADGVSIYTVALGDSADRKLFSSIGQGPRNAMFDTDDSAELSSIFLGAFAKRKGEALTIDRAESEVFSSSNPPLFFSINATEPPEKEEFEFDIAGGATRINLLIAPREMKASNWSVDFRLFDPNGDLVGGKGCSGECAKVVEDSYFTLVELNSPISGRWKVELSPGVDGVAQRSYVTAHVENEGPDCFVSLATRTLAKGEGMEVEVTPANGMLIDSGVAYSGSVSRPDGVELPLVFERDEDRLVDVARIEPSLLNSRGSYKVRVRCEVQRGAKVFAGESVFAPEDEDEVGAKAPKNQELVPPFSREVSTSFFYDSDVFGPLPPGNDADNDGIPNDQEPAGDLDGDGRPNVVDDDADGDDVPDIEDPDPTDPNLPNPKPNSSPIAKISGSLQVECEGNSSLARLSGSQSTDPEGGVLEYRWSCADCDVLQGSSENFEGEFSVGTHPVQLVVIDDLGLSSLPATANLEVVDTQPPEIAELVQTFKSCDHRPVDLTVQRPSVSDACSSVELQGQVVSKNGVALSTVIPVSDTPLQLTPGNYEINWTSIDAYGNSASRISRLDVLVEANSLRCCPGTYDHHFVGTPEEDVAIGTLFGDSSWIMETLGGNDFVSTHSGDDCILSGSGDDSVATGSGSNIVYAGLGVDAVNSCKIISGGKVEVFLAQGNDLVETFWCDEATIYGGEGDDVIRGSLGRDEIVPGPGIDTVLAGAGDDIVKVYALCEVGPGEILDGGSGQDTLVSALTVAQLESAGVTVSGFENVEVRPELSRFAQCDGTL